MIVVEVRCNGFKNVLGSRVGLGLLLQRGKIDNQCGLSSSGSLS